MNLYYSIADPLDVRDISDLYAMWVEIGNPKADLWAEQPPEPAHDFATQIAMWTKDAKWAIINIEPEVHAITKLTLMRRLNAMGKWDDFKSILTQLPDAVREAWDLALEIRSDDLLFLANAEIIQVELGLTIHQFKELLRE
jgi:hypothetical protein